MNYFGSIFAMVVCIARVSLITVRQCDVCLTCEQ